MAFNGSGTFSRIHDWTTDEGNAVNITASRMDAEDDGFATGLSTTICKDGQTTTTARIPFAVGLGVNDGLVGTPSLAFTSDTDTGFYRIGSGNVGLALNGVARATWAVDSAMTVTINSAATNTVTNVLTLTSQSSGTPAAGIGAGIALIAETAAGNDETGAVIEAVTTDVTSTSEDFDLVFKTMAAGAAAAERARVASTGVTTLTSDNATNTAVTNVLSLVHTTSGSPTAGIGTGVQFVTETAAANNETGAVIEAVTTDVSAASEDFDLVFKTMQAGAAADEKFRITSDDKLKQTIGSTTYQVATQLVHTAETTVTTVADLDIKDLPTGTKELLIRVTELEPATNGDEFFMRVSTDNGATFKTGAAEYEWHKDTAVDVSAGSDYDISDSEWEIMENVATGSAGYGYIRIFFGTNRTWYESSFNYDISSSTHAFVRTQGFSPFNGNAVKLYFSSGNITSLTYSVIATVG
jgi:hypothetical protein